MCVEDLLPAVHCLEETTGFQVELSQASIAGLAACLSLEVSSGKWLPWCQQWHLNLPQSKPWGVRSLQISRECVLYNGSSISQDWGSECAWPPKHSLLGMEELAVLGALVRKCRRAPLTGSECRFGSLRSLGCWAGAHPISLPSHLAS